MIHPGFLKILRGSSEASLRRFLRTLPKEQLLICYRNFFPPSCDCELIITDCVMHSQWQEWRDEGYTAKEIAHAWYRLRRQRFHEDTVAAFFEHSQRSQCDCYVGERAIPCHHILEQEYVLPHSCQVFIIEELQLDDYVDRRESVCPPFINGDVAAQVKRMAERVALGMSPFKDGDTFGRTAANFTRDAHHGPNGQSAGPGGASLAGDWRIDRGTKSCGS